MPAPEAVNLGKYGDIPVGHYSGVPNISIPIYTATQGPLSVPLALSYHASGVKVGETASRTGLGWTIQSGGIINRTVQGIPDEDIGGYYTTGNQIPTDPSSCAFGLYAQETSIGLKDSEPDIFSFSLLGYSGKFYFNADTVLPDEERVVLVPQRDLKIKPYFDGVSDGNLYAALNKFEITTPDGTIYEFGDIGDGSPAFEVSQAGGDGHKTPSGWYLKRIRSYDGEHQITYTYESEKYSFKYLASKNSTQCYAPSSPPVPAYLLNWMEGKRLTQISTDLEVISFVYGSEREDLEIHPIATNAAAFKAKVLDRIEISTGAFCKKFKFSYDYFVDNSSYATGAEEDKRLQLLSVQQKSCNGVDMIPAYTFEYYEKAGNPNFLPNRLSKATDHWGFYNGQDSNNDIPDSELNIPKVDGYWVHGGTNQTFYNTYFGQANRTTDETAMRYGTLKRSTYPTGGHTELEYEANDYYGLVTNTSVNTLVEVNHGYPYPGICNTQTSTGTPNPVSFSAAALPTLEYEYEIKTHQTCNCTQQSGTLVGMEIKVYNGSSLVATSGQININCAQGTQYGDTGLLQDLFGNNLQSGVNYTFKIEGTNCAAFFKVLEMTTTSSNDNIKVGGLRVKKVTSHDGIATVNDIIRTYEYRDQYNTTESSGELYQQPLYWSNYSFPPDPGLCGSPGGGTGGGGIVFFDASVVPLGSFEGYHIGYGYVKESLNGNGFNAYAFFTEPATQQSGFPIPPAYARIQAGNTSSLHQKLNNGISKAYTTNTPENDPYVYSTDMMFKSQTFSLSACSSTPITHRNVYNIRTRPYRLKEVKNVLDDVSSTTNFTYNSQGKHLFPEKEIFTNSDGTTYTKTFKYPNDFSGSIYTELENRFIIIPLETTTEVGANTLIDGTRTDYALFNGHPYPEEFWRYEATQVNNVWTGTWKTQGVINGYTNGYPTSFTQEGWETEYYTWTAAGLIDQRQYKDFIWTYNYHPNTRLLSEIVDIDGQDTDFTYDGLMRLKTANARDGNVITTYDYYFTTGGSDKNYVKTRTDFSPIGDSKLTWQENWQYLDGLGRPLQTVQRRHGHNEQDVITGAVEYDNQGRVVKQYEPFGGSYNLGTFINPSGQDYTLTEYYDDPLNRIHKITPPSWYATTYEYGNNTASISAGGVSYSAASLNTTTLTDPEGIQTISFNDKRGRTILSSTKKGSNQTDTYTLYDDKDRVKTILPPDVTSTTSALAYQYQYDGADNIIGKYIPDMGWSNYLYDTRNLPTASQDPKLLSEGKWLCNIYDDYGRITQTGFHNENNNSLQGNNPVIHQVLTSTLYDAACGQTTAIYTGKTCQTRSRILNTNNWLETNFEYDNFGRTTHTKGNSHVNLTIGSEQSTFIYDYADNPVSTSRIHDAFGQQMVIAERMTYDHAGRLDETFHRVGTGAEQLISKQEYTIKDELSTKHLGGVSNGFLQKLDYVYLDNGFLKDINPTMETNDLFQFTINYDGGNGTLNATAQKNGNISQLTWQVKGKTKQSYGFQYDFLNRLTEATYGDYGTGALQANNKYSSTYGYDNRGNIMSLTRQGFLPNSTYAQIDNLSYAYNSNSNRLKSISDTAPTASKAEGYKPGLSTDYGYDANGNMNYDPSKDVNIRYNHLNLPEFIEFDNCNAIEYTYNATGIKLTKTLKKGNGIISTHDYIGDIEYKNQVVDAIYHLEGRLYFEGASSRYEYVLKDHLGNNRVTFTDKDGNGVIDITTNTETNEVLEESHFYPFGMRMEGNFVQHTGNENRYLFNGIERNEDFGLGWDMALFRSYDPAIARWNQIDPLSNMATSWTPYRFGFNNPLIYSDPAGLFESRKEARRYKRRNKVKGRIRKNKEKREDGSTNVYYSIDDRGSGTSTFMDPSLGIVSGPLATISSARGSKTQLPNSYSRPPEMGTWEYDMYTARWNEDGTYTWFYRGSGEPYIPPTNWAEAFGRMFAGFGMLKVTKAVNSNMAHAVERV